MKLTAIALLIVIGLTGCGPARRVVVPPEQVSGLNSPDWTVRSEPAKTEEGKTR